MEYSEILFENLLTKICVDAYAAKVGFVLSSYFRTDRYIPDRVNRSTGNSLLKFRRNVLENRSLQMIN